MKSRKPQKFKLYFWKAYFTKTKRVMWKVEVKGKGAMAAGTVLLQVPTRTEVRSRNPHAVITGIGVVRRGAISGTIKITKD
jgi:hypothetical protein